MDFFGSIFESLFGDGPAADGIADLAGGLVAGTVGSGGRDRPAEGEVPYAYARYLCGGPKTLGINDR